MYNKRAMTYFTLIFDNEEVQCHKHILAASFPALEAIMVENKHRESIEGIAAFKTIFRVSIFNGDLSRNPMSCLCVAIGNTS